MIYYYIVAEMIIILCLIWLTSYEELGLSIITPKFLVFAFATSGVLYLIQLLVIPIFVLFQLPLRYGIGMRIDMVNYENTYWCEKGKYQEQYDSIKHLVPDSGKSDNPAVELLRCMGNIYHDVYNNGGCNFDVRHEEIKHLNKFMLSQGVKIDWLGWDYKYDPSKVWVEEVESWWDEDECEYEEYDDNNYFDFNQNTCDDLEIIADTVILHVFNTVKNIMNK